MPTGNAGTSKAVSTAAKAPHTTLAALATAIFRLASVTHGKVKVPCRAKRHLTALTVLGLVQEETAPVRVRIVGNFFVQHVIECRSHVHIVFVSATVLAVLEQAFKIVQVFFQVFFLGLLDIFLFRVMQNDVQAVRGTEAFLFDGTAACTTRIGTRLVECPNVAAGNAVARDIGFFKFAHVYTILATLNLFEKHVHTAINTVDVQVKMPATGAIMPGLPKEPMGKRITHHTLVYIRTVEHPVVTRREPKQAHVHAFAFFVADFHAITRLREHGRRLTTNLDTDIIACALGTVSHIVRFSVQHLHGCRNLFSDLVIEALALGVNKHYRQIVCLRKCK